MLHKKLRALGVILPQFHPIPENDAWWGKGFTEWTNVTKATPRFRGHYQPHLPADLGFYDLRLLESHIEQAQLAQEHGIYGFCYHHYWFNGKQLLEMPVNLILESKKPDIPFLLCWANENWTRRWDGQDQEVLIKQEYSAEDHKEHAKWLCDNVFNDSRYIKIDDKPVFLFFNTDIIPNLKETVRIWKSTVKKCGYPDLYLAAVRISHDRVPDAIELGFDCTVEWQPDWEELKIIPNFIDRVKNKVGIGNRICKMSYKEASERMMIKPLPKNKHYQAIMPGWDNSARRRNNPFILDGSTPELYEKWLELLCEKAMVYSEEENFIFLNAMNEWAEGNHLEPDQKWGCSYLEKTKKVLKKYL